MDRRLQSSLEKKTRVGWQTRVYRLERGYLSGWADVSSAAAHEEPSRVMCLFQGEQVATLSDQGDKRFKLDFPWDGTKTLQLRSNNTAMKEAWVGLLRATLQEAASQIKATGAVFAYGGTAQHEQDEAYEEAAYLKTNRFLAAYVVDEQSRASYVNDLLNEGFQHMGDRAGSGGDARRACAGARAAIAELLALTEDFEEEMKGVEQLRRGSQGGGGAASSSPQLNPSVAAPKIERFCEEHMSLVGRTISSRLMLELSPFMDSSVAGTSAAPTDDTRAELVATRKRLDEAYEATDQMVILGSRAWFMDIRDFFLDCTGLEQATAAPPSPPPGVATQTADFGSPPPQSPPAGANPPPAAAGAPPAPALSPDGLSSAMRSSSKALSSKASSAFSAAKAATKGGASRMGSSLGSIKGRTGAGTGTGLGLAAEKKALGPGQDGGGPAGGRGSSALAGVNLSVSIPGVFRRGSSRTATAADKKTPAPAVAPAATPPSPKPTAGGPSPRGSASLGSGSGGKVKLSSPRPDNEDREREDLFGGSSRSPSTSPRGAGSKTLGTSPGTRSPSRKSPFLPAGAGQESAAGSNFSAAAAGCAAAASSLPAAATASGPAARKEKRAFAGGVWGGGGGGGGGGGSGSASAPQTTEAGHTDETPAAAVDKAVPAAAATVPLPTSSGGGKRRFAGGVFSGPMPATAAAASASQPTAQPPADNPFGAGGGGGGGVRMMGGGRAGAARGASALEGEHGAAGGGRDAEQAAVPSWAATAGAEESVPDWAASAPATINSYSFYGGGKGKGKEGSGGKSNGVGLAPPSRADQGQQAAADSSPFMTVDPVAPAVRRPSQRRPGESGSRRAFGGGERLF